MRHLLSLVLGLVLAPLIYIAAGFSADHLGSVDINKGVALGTALLGLAYALAAGGLYSVLVMARLSPFGPVLAGLLYLGVSVWVAVAPSNFLHTLPKSFLGNASVLIVPAGWGTAVLAVPLLLTIFSPRRWRRSAQPALVGYQAAPIYSPTTTASPYESPVYTPSSAAPAYSPLPAQATTYASPAGPPPYTPGTYETPTLTNPTVTTPTDPTAGQ
jgi:hypothetical protein